MPLKNGRQSSDLQTILVGSVIPAGTIAPFGGGTVPTGWMLCNGSAISRTTYSALFSSIGTSHGQGDGTTTFNLPDYRGQFLRGRVDINTVSGSGIAASNNATFNNHGINRTGFKVRLSSGTLSGLATSTDYFAIVINSNTLAFATTQANALAGTKVAISGANSAVITQFEDPDASSRLASNVGGNSGNNLGSNQSAAIPNLRSPINHVTGGNNLHPANNPIYWGTYQPAGTTYGGVAGNSQTAGLTLDASRVSNVYKNDVLEARPSNTIVNYIIKY